MKRIEGLLSSVSRFMKYLVLLLPLVVAVALPENAALASQPEHPVVFERNGGQTHESVAFFHRGDRYTLFLAPTEAVFALHEHHGPERSLPWRTAPGPGLPERDLYPPEIVRLQFLGADRLVRLEGAQSLPSSSHYFFGDDRSRWITDSSHYGRVHYRNLYEGIDRVFRGHEGRVEIVWIVQPGFDPYSIKLRWEGADRATLDEDGNLRLDSHSGQFILRAPKVYQVVDGAKRLVVSRYVLQGGDDFRIQVGAYDSHVPLVIDPVIVFSSQWGGSGIEQLVSGTVTPEGDVVLMGETRSLDFPTEQPTQGGLRGATDIFVSKFRQDGAVLFSTFLGGAGIETAGRNSVALDQDGNVFLAGVTCSEDFPTIGAIQTARRGPCDGVIAKLTASGSAILYSTYFGGGSFDGLEGVSVDSFGNAFATGFTVSSDLTSKDPFQATIGGGRDALVVKLDPDGQLAFATYLGGESSEDGFAVDVDVDGNVLVNGFTSSLGFPLLNPAQSSLGGEFDVFISKLTPSGTSLVYSTYLGGPGFDSGEDVRADRFGNAYLVGASNAAGFPTRGEFQSYQGGSFDAVFAKLGPFGDLVFSSYLGGSGGDAAFGIALDALGSLHVTGATDSPDFPVMKPLQPALSGGRDAFLASVGPNGNQLIQSTYLGGSALDAALSVRLDASERAYVAGDSESSDFPTKNAAQNGLAGVRDGFIAKIEISNDGERIDVLIERATELVRGGRGVALVRTLEQAADSLNRGNVMAAMGQIQAFINEVQSLITSGALSEIDGQQMIDAASVIVRRILGM